MSSDNKTGTVFSAVILSSGLSERMGTPKALLMWDRSMTFLEKNISEYVNAGADKVICTVNRHVLPFCESLEKWENVSFVLNDHPDWGRMYSIKLGLGNVKESPYCFIQNVDNPHINSEMIREMLIAVDTESWCSPEYLGKGGHPVLLSSAIINRILKEQENDLSLQDLLRSFPKRIVEMPDDSLLKNINTPEDYKNFLGRNIE